MSDLPAKTTAWHSTTNEVFHFIIDTVGDGVKSNKENRFGEEGVSSLTQPVSVTVTVTIQETVLR